MAWVRLDDRFDKNPKVLIAMQISPAAPFLFVSSLCYCRSHMTGGVLTKLAVQGLTGYSKRAKDALITAGLWHELSMGVITIHDYAEVYATEELEKEKKERRSEINRQNALKRYSKEKQDAASS